MNLGTAIRTLRKEKGITQTEMARAVNMSKNAISLIELNTAWPHKTTIEAICKVLNVKIEYLLFLCIVDAEVHKDLKAPFKTLCDAMKVILS